MNEPLKIIQVVTFNVVGEAWVLNRAPRLEYERHGDTIIGMDFPLFNCYGYEHPAHGFRAFGGREFEIKLVGGEIIRCNGQWWSGVTPLAKSLIGGEVADVTAKDIDALQKCYVFSGFVGEMESLQEFRAGYTGNIIPYWDYEKILRERNVTNDQR
jgi:hypothetical protein